RRSPMRCMRSTRTAAISPPRSASSWISWSSITAARRIGRRAGTFLPRWKQLTSERTDYHSSPAGACSLQKHDASHLTPASHIRRTDMNISILGTGNMASGLASLFAASGHKVTLGSRDSAKAQTVAAGLGSGIAGGTFADAARDSEIVVLAVPYE